MRLCLLGVQVACDTSTKACEVHLSLLQNRALIELGALFVGNFFQQWRIFIFFEAWRVLRKSCSVDAGWHF